MTGSYRIALRPDDDVDAWLLDRYETLKQQRKTGTPVGNYVRPLFQLVPDIPPGSSEDAPAFTGAALWPRPALHADLDEIERREEQR